jgi:27-O-demethylrifamycin SV methyltransferase
MASPRSSHSDYPASVDDAGPPTLAGLSYEPATHYDRITEAWTLLLGEELHYGVFAAPDESLSGATGRLTQLMADAGQVQRGVRVLDVGCGTGAPACYLASTRKAHVLGITTSEVGVQAASARAATEGVTDLASFEQRDGMDNGLAAASFDRVWVLESSHLMRDRERLMSECARVLRPGGRLVLCDIVLRRPMPFAEVRRLREPLALLRDVFGDARMEPLAEYRRLAGEFGLAVDDESDLTDATRPTFARWRQNAELNGDKVDALIGETERQRFLESCDVLERFWDDGTLGYGLIAAVKR